MTYTRLCTLCFFLLLVTPVRAGDPHPPQINVTFLAQPAAIVQEGSTRLYYEMIITNVAKDSYVLEAVEAKAGATQTKFNGQALTAMIVRLGAWGQPESRADRTIEGGRGVIVFLASDLGRGKVPSTIEHSLHVVDGKGEAHDVVLAPVPVSNESPIVVAPPLRGEWIAGDSINNGPQAAHRRAVLVDNGHAWLAQRYAIDWMQYQTVDGRRTTWRGPEDKNDSYFCYDQPIYSVADGEVIDMSDGMAENVPHSGKHAVAIDFNNAAGNHVVVEIAPHRYVLYAHMRPGTVQAKIGDKIGVGQIIGHVGNTGSSAEPHLHLHIDDQPSFLAGNGVPYEFTNGEASGPVDANVSSPTAVYFGPIGPQKPFTTDYPAENALVTFK
jgi:murein DD-endopeptidase MepM/ murein hydrolase activator NlpD